MSVQPKTSDELADMLTSLLNITGVKVGVEPDQIDGWHPVIVAARSSADKYKQLADEVASELRLVYELNF
jgi:hypothetical protein